MGVQNFYIDWMIIKNFHQETSIHFKKKCSKVQSYLFSYKSRCSFSLDLIYVVIFQNSLKTWERGKMFNFLLSIYAWKYSFYISQNSSGNLQSCIFLDSLPQQEDMYFLTAQFFIDSYVLVSVYNFLMSCFFIGPKSDHCLALSVTKSISTEGTCCETCESRSRSFPFRVDA